MYQLEYLFYHLRPFFDGGHLGNKPATTNELKVRDFLRISGVGGF